MNRSVTTIRRVEEKIVLQFTSPTTGLYITIERDTMDEVMAALSIATSDMICEAIIRAMNLDDDETRRRLTKFATDHEL